MKTQDFEMHTIDSQGSEGQSMATRNSDGGSRQERAGKGTTNRRGDTCPWIVTILALDGTNTRGRETLKAVERSDWNLRKGIANWPTLWEMRELTTDKGHPSFEGWTDNNRQSWACLDRWMRGWDEKMARALCQACWRREKGREQTQVSAHEELVLFWTLAHVEDSTRCAHATSLVWLWKTQPPQSGFAWIRIRKMIERSTPARAEGHRVFCMTLWMIMLDQGMGTLTDSGRQTGTATPMEQGLDDICASENLSAERAPSTSASVEQAHSTEIEPRQGLQATPGRTERRKSERQWPFWALVGIKVCGVVITGHSWIGTTGSSTRIDYEEMRDVMNNGQIAGIMGKDNWVRHPGVEEKVKIDNLDHIVAGTKVWTQPSHASEPEGQRVDATVILKADYRRHAWLSQEQRRKAWSARVYHNTGEAEQVRGEIRTALQAWQRSADCEGTELDKEDIKEVRLWTKMGTHRFASQLIQQATSSTLQMISLRRNVCHSQQDCIRTLLGLICNEEGVIIGRESEDHTEKQKQPADDEGTERQGGTAGGRTIIAIQNLMHEEEICGGVSGTHKYHIEKILFAMARQSRRIRIRCSVHCPSENGQKRIKQDLKLPPAVSQARPWIQERDKLGIDGTKTAVTNIRAERAEPQEEQEPEERGTPARFDLFQYQFRYGNIKQGMYVTCGSYMCDKSFKVRYTDNQFGHCTICANVYHSEACWARSHPEEESERGHKGWNRVCCMVYEPAKIARWKPGGIMEDVTQQSSTAGETEHQDHLGSVQNRCWLMGRGRSTNISDHRKRMGDLAHIDINQELRAPAMQEYLLTALRQRPASMPSIALYDFNFFARAVGVQAFADTINKHTNPFRAEQLLIFIPQEQEKWVFVIVLNANEEQWFEPQEGEDGAEEAEEGTEGSVGEKTGRRGPKVFMNLYHWGQITDHELTRMSTDIGDQIARYLAHQRSLRYKGDDYLLPHFEVKTEIFQRDSPTGHGDSSPGEHPIIKAGELISGSEATFTGSITTSQHVHWVVNHQRALWKRECRSQIKGMAQARQHVWHCPDCGSKLQPVLKGDRECRAVLRLGETEGRDSTTKMLQEWVETELQLVDTSLGIQSRSSEGWLEERMVWRSSEECSLRLERMWNVRLTIDGATAEGEPHSARDSGSIISAIGDPLQTEGSQIGDGRGHTLFRHLRRRQWHGTLTVQDRPFHTTPVGRRLVSGRIWMSGMEEQEAKEWISEQVAKGLLQILGKRPEEIEIVAHEGAGSSTQARSNLMLSTEPLRIMVEWGNDQDVAFEGIRADQRWRQSGGDTVSLAPLQMNIPTCTDSRCTDTFRADVQGEWEQVECCACKRNRHRTCIKNALFREECVREEEDAWILEAFGTPEEEMTADQYRIGAELGHMEAMHALGLICLRYGNVERACDWLTRVEQQPRMRHKHYLRAVHRLRQLAPSTQWTGGQIKELIYMGEAEAWAQYALARILEVGCNEVPQDREHAHRVHVQALRAGFRGSLRHLTETNHLQKVWTCQECTGTVATHARSHMRGYCISPITDMTIPDVKTLNLTGKRTPQTLVRSGDIVWCENCEFSSAAELGEQLDQRWGERRWTQDTGVGTAGAENGALSVEQRRLSAFSEQREIVHQLLDKCWDPELTRSQCIHSEASDDCEQCAMLEAMARQEGSGTRDERTDGTDSVGAEDGFGEADVDCESPSEANLNFVDNTEGPRPNAGEEETDGAQQGQQRQDQTLLEEDDWKDIWIQPFEPGRVSRELLHYLARHAWEARQEDPNASRLTMNTIRSPNMTSQSRAGLEDTIRLFNLNQKKWKLPIWAEIRGRPVNFTRPFPPGAEIRMWTGPWLRALRNLGRIRRILQESFTVPAMTAIEDQNSDRAGFEKALEIMAGSLHTALLTKIEVVPESDHWRARQEMIESLGGRHTLSIYERGRVVMEAALRSVELWGPKSQSAAIERMENMTPPYYRIHHESDQFDHTLMGEERTLCARGDQRERDRCMTYNIEASKKRKEKRPGRGTVVSKKQRLKNRKERQAQNKKKGRKTTEPGDQEAERTDRK